MSRESWALIKQKKSFNVNAYRRGLAVLIFSLILSSALSAFIFLRYLAIPERDYYATSGIAPPVQLKVMFAPNLSSQALLDADPPTDDSIRVIPD